MWSPKIPPPFFSNKIFNTNKKCMVWTFFFNAQKCHCFRSRYQKATICVRVKSYFYHKLLFGDIKLSDLEHRNTRKLSAHDCTDHIKTLFSSDSYHETRNINTSQAAMLLVPGHNCAILLVPVHKIHNVR